MTQRFAVIILSVLLAGCTKTDFQLRIRNNLSKDLLKITMNGLDCQPVNAGSTGDYIMLVPGTYHLDGNTSTGFFTAEVTLQGKGRQLYTLTVDADKQVKLIRDE